MAPVTSGAKNPGIVASVLDIPVKVPAKFGASSCIRNFLISIFSLQHCICKDGLHSTLLILYITEQLTFKSKK